MDDVSCHEKPGEKAIPTSFKIWPNVCSTFTETNGFIVCIIIYVFSKGYGCSLYNMCFVFLCRDIYICGVYHVCSVCNIYSVYIV